MAARLIRNRAKCLLCGDVIESVSTHDFVRCSCGALAVDGGTAYARRVFKDRDAYQDMSVFEDDNEDERGEIDG